MSTNNKYWELPDKKWLRGINIRHKRRGGPDSALLCAVYETSLRPELIIKQLKANSASTMHFWLGNNDQIVNDAVGFAVVVIKFKLKFQASNYIDFDIEALDGALLKPLAIGSIANPKLTINKILSQPTPQRSKNISKRGRVERETE
jgi:hypothetical protein